MFETYKSIGEAKKIMQIFKPDVLIGTGGYICVPTVIAASKLGIPVVFTRKVTRFRGIAVKLFKKKANKILVGFKRCKRKDLIIEKNVVVTGKSDKAKKTKLYRDPKSKNKTRIRSKT